jgi:Protein of unknown function (DUF3014)
LQISRVATEASTYTRCGQNAVIWKPSSFPRREQPHSSFAKRLGKTRRSVGERWVDRLCEAAVNMFDDQPLVRTESSDSTLDVPPPRSDSRVLIAIGVCALVLGGVGAWWWSHRNAAPPAKTAAVNSTEGVISTAPAERALPPLGQMDTFVRALVGALSSNPTLAQWLATDDLLRQVAAAIDRISRGQSPARNLAVLRPRDVIEVRGPRSRLAIDPQSYRRYDAVTGALMSLNPKGVAEAYRTIEPRLEEAYRALGSSENTVDEAVAVALNVLIATPEVQDPIRVTPGKGATYAFADPKLEALPPIQKQLIRMGPQNAAAIDERLREIAAAIAATPRRTN